MTEAQDLAPASVAALLEMGLPAAWHVSHVVGTGHSVQSPLPFSWARSSLPESNIFFQSVN